MTAAHTMLITECNTFAILSFSLVVGCLTATVEGSATEPACSYRLNLPALFLDMLQSYYLPMKKIIIGSYHTKVYGAAENGC